MVSVNTDLYLPQNKTVFLTMLDFIIYLFFKTACTTYFTSLHTTFKNREIKLVQFSDQFRCV